jgi:hypothetical protein
MSGVEGVKWCVLGGGGMLGGAKGACGGGGQSGSVTLHLWPHTTFTPYGDTTDSIQNQKYFSFEAFVDFFKQLLQTYTTPALGTPAYTLLRSARRVVGSPLGPGEGGLGVRLGSGEGGGEDCLIEKDQDNFPLP